MKSVSRVYHMIPLSPFSAEVEKKIQKKKNSKKLRGATLKEIFVQCAQIYFLNF